MTFDLLWLELGVDEQFDVTAAKDRISTQRTRLLDQIAAANGLSREQLAALGPEQVARMAENFTGKPASPTAMAQYLAEYVS